MFLNIITPCFRLRNLSKIASSINIPLECYRWLVVFDSESLPDSKYIPSNCEPYFIKDKNSKFGNLQRNYALNLINKGYIYFNDDDTVLHPNLWKNIENITHIDLIAFGQIYKNGVQRLAPGDIKLNKIDSHNFISKYETCKDIRFHPNLYNADGIFAEQVFEKSENYLIIKKNLSTYNYLR